MRLALLTSSFLDRRRVQPRTAFFPFFHISCCCFFDRLPVLFLKFLVVAPAGSFLGFPSTEDFPQTDSHRGVERKQSCRSNIEESRWGTLQKRKDPLARALLEGEREVFEGGEDKRTKSVFLNCSSFFVVPAVFEGSICYGIVSPAPRRPGPFDWIFPFVTKAFRGFLHPFFLYVPAHLGSPALTTSRLFLLSGDLPPIEKRAFFCPLFFFRSCGT